MFFLLRSYPQRRQPLAQQPSPFLQKVRVRPAHQQMGVAGPVLKTIHPILLILRPMPSCSSSFGPIPSAASLSPSSPVHSFKKSEYARHISKWSLRLRCLNPSTPSSLFLGRCPGKYSQLSFCFRNASET